MIPVFFTFDNNYSAQCGVTLISILTNKHKSINYAFYVISDDLSIENKNRLNAIVKEFEGSSITFIQGDEQINFDYHEKLENKRFGDTFLTKQALYRCYPDLISEFEKYDKIIYSDVDIVVVKDISELYDIDIEEHYLIGCKTPYFLHQEITHLDPSIQEKYFAGGLWVMNLKKFREDKMNERVTEIINDKSLNLIWNEQDVMNIACQGNVKYFDYKYISIPDWKYILESVDYVDEYYPNKELEEIIMNPSIIHYAGIKPWIVNTTIPRLYELWYYWVSKTPYANDYKDLEVFANEKNSKFIIKIFGIFKFKNIPIRIHYSPIIEIKFLNIPILKIKKI